MWIIDGPDKPENRTEADNETIAQLEAENSIPLDEFVELQWQAEVDAERRARRFAAAKVKLERHRAAQAEAERKTIPPLGVALGVTIPHIPKMAKAATVAPKQEVKRPSRGSLVHLFDQYVMQALLLMGLGLVIVWVILGTAGLEVLGTSFGRSIGFLPHFLEQFQQGYEQGKQATGGR
jgi:septal ring factor EnvC (AmiA/AmiB activator)